MLITKPISVLLIAAAAAFTSLSPARAETTAQVIETSPSDGALLGHNESFWVRIEYATDKPISLWARPYRNGVQITKTMSNASLTYTGKGEALGWFALIDPGEIDEVRIIAGGGKPYHEWELAREPIRLRWTNGPVSAETRPQWVEDLLALEKQRRAEDVQKRAMEPRSLAEIIFSSVLMFAMLALVLAGISVPVRSLWKWRGGWRIAAAIPTCALLFVILRIIVDTTRDPTSHNLWPFEILMFGVPALGMIGLLKIARRVMNVES